MISLDKIFKKRQHKQLYVRVVYQVMNEMKYAPIRNVFNNADYIREPIRKALKGAIHGNYLLCYRAIGISAKYYNNHFSGVHSGDTIELTTRGAREVFSWTSDKTIAQKWQPSKGNTKVIFIAKIPVDQIYFATKYFDLKDFVKYAGTDRKANRIAYFWREEEVTVDHSKPIDAKVLTSYKIER